jgi:vacuolar-type H+-ATPase subunit B/Vma2
MAYTIFVIIYIINNNNDIFNYNRTLDYQWDYKMCNDNNLNLIVKELIQKAHST